jgi:hypothetical protein
MELLKRGQSVSFLLAFCQIEKSRLHGEVPPPEKIGVHVTRITSAVTGLRRYFCSKMQAVTHLAFSCGGKNYHLHMGVLAKLFHQMSYALQTQHNVFFQFSHMFLLALQLAFVEVRNIPNKLL